MSAYDRNLDLSFLSGEEADLVREVLERDRRLNKREKERVERLKGTQGVWPWLTAESLQGANDLPPSLTHLPQKPTNLRIKSTELSTPHRQREGDRSAPSLLNGSSFRTKFTSFFTFRFSYRKGNAKQGSSREDRADVESCLPADTVRPGSEAGEHTEVKCEVTPDKGKAASFDKEESCTNEEQGLLKEAATGLGGKQTEPAGTGPAWQEGRDPGLGLGAGQHSSTHQSISGEEEELTSPPEKGWTEPRPDLKVPEEVPFFDHSGQTPECRGNTEPESVSQTEPQTVSWTPAAAYPQRTHRSLSLPSLLSDGYHDSKPPLPLSSLSSRPPVAMLSSALVTVLAPPWSGRFRRHKTEQGEGPRQEVGEWTRFLKQWGPYTRDSQGGPSNATATTFQPPHSLQEQSVQNWEVFHPDETLARGRLSLAAWPSTNTPLSKPDAPPKRPLTKSRTLDNREGAGVTPLTPPVTPPKDSSQSLDQQGYRRLSQAVLPMCPSTRYRDKEGMLSSKPTTSSLLLSLRRLGSAKGNPNTGQPFTETPPPSPDSPAEGDPSTGPSIRQGQLPPSPRRSGRRDLTEWLDFLNTQSLMRRNTLRSSAWRKRGQQSDDSVLPGNTTATTNQNQLNPSNSTNSTNRNILTPDNTVAATNQNVLTTTTTTTNVTNRNLLNPNSNSVNPSNSTTMTNHNLVIPNKTVTVTSTSSTETGAGKPTTITPSNTVTVTNHNLLRPSNTVSSTSNNMTGADITMGSTNLNVVSPNRPETGTGKTAASLSQSLSRSATHDQTLSVLNTYNLLKTSTLPPPSTPSSPDTIISDRNLRNPSAVKTPITTNAVDTRKTFSTPSTPVSPSSPLNFCTPISSNSAGIPNSPKTPNTATSSKPPLNLNTTTSSNLKRINTQNSPISSKPKLNLNTPFISNTSQSPSTHDSPISSKPKLNLNTPFISNTSQSPSTHDSPISSKPKLNLNTPFISNTSQSPSTHDSPISSKPKLNLNTPFISNTSQSPSTHDSPISSKPKLNLNTPFISNTSQSPSTHDSPISSKPKLNLNTPFISNTSQSPSTHDSPISSKPKLNLNTPFISNTSQSPSTHDSPISSKPKLNLNTPFISNTSQSPSTHDSPISSKPKLNLNTPFISNTSQSPSTHDSPISSKPKLNLNTPFISNTSQSPSTHDSPISSKPKLNLNTPFISNTSQSPRTHDSPISSKPKLNLNTPIISNTTKNPKTPDTAASSKSPLNLNTTFTSSTNTQNSPISSKPPLHLNMPFISNTLKSFNTQHAPVSSKPPLNLKTHFDSNSLKSPNTHNLPLSPNSSLTVNTPSTPNAPKSPNIPNTSLASRPPLNLNTPITSNTPKSPNPPNSPVSPKSAQTLNTTVNPDIFRSLNSPVSSNHPSNFYTRNSPNTPVSPKTISSPLYNYSTSSPWAQPAEERVGPNSLSGGEKRGETEVWVARSPRLSRSPCSMESPTVFSSLRAAGPSGRLSDCGDPKSSPSSPDPDPTFISWRSHYHRGPSPIPKFTFSSSGESQRPQQNTPPLSPSSSLPERYRLLVSPVSTLRSAHPLYKNSESQPPLRSPGHGPGSCDGVWAVRMVSAGDVSSPGPAQPRSGKTGASLPEWAGIPGQVRGDSPTRHHRMSKSAFPFPSESEIEIPASEPDTGRTPRLSHSASQRLQPSVAIPQSPPCPNNFSQSPVNSRDSPTNQGSPGIGTGFQRYERSPRSLTEHAPAVKGPAAFQNNPPGVAVRKEPASVPEECGPVLPAKHQHNKRSPLAFRRGQGDASPPTSGSSREEAGKAMTARGKGSHRVDQVLTRIKMTFSPKRFENESLTTSKKSKKTLPPAGSGSSHVPEAGGAGGTSDQENKMDNDELSGRSRSGQVTPQPTWSMQPECVQTDLCNTDNGGHGLRDDNGNLTRQRYPCPDKYATVPGRLRRRGISWFSHDPENEENENMFDSVSGSPRHGRCNDTERWWAGGVHGNGSKGLKSSQQRGPLHGPLCSPSSSPSPRDLFVPRYGRSFSVSSVVASRPSGCERISTGPLMGSANDLRMAGIAMPTAGWDSGGSRPGNLNRSMSCSLDRNDFMERVWDDTPSPTPTPPGSPRPARRISSSSTTSRTSQGSSSPRSRLPSRGYKSSLSAFEESDSDSTTDDEYYLSGDRGERETAL